MLGKKVKNRTDDDIVSMVMDIEICIEGTLPETACQAATAAFQGGAARVELCRDMTREGLTPSVMVIQTVRVVIGAGCGLVVMIRPRAGDFCYSRDEMRVMISQIQEAAQAGADGVVFGALRTNEGRVCERTMRLLMRASSESGLTVTFHRAFDAVPDRDEALDTLVELGVGRVLTSGCPWGGYGTALDGLDHLQQTITRAAGRIEVVIGGGITAPTLPKLLTDLPLEIGPVSVHAYSGAQCHGITTMAAVRRLVEAARNRHK